MMHVKKISVLTSLYNCESFLPGYFKALAAIEGKEQIEVLLLHNAPSDSELNIVNKYLPSMDFVRHIVIPEREGLYTTWNRGISLSEGEYITVWNVDDVRFPAGIIQQAEMLDKHSEAALAYGDIWLSDSYGICGSIRTNVPLSNEKKFFFKSYGISCFQMWRRSIHETIGYYDEQFKCSADFDFQIRVALHFPMVKTPDILGISLENQPHKLSANGLQELENNIVYLRYGSFGRINLFTLRRSLKIYHKTTLFHYGKQITFDETSPFGRSYRIMGWISSLFFSLILVSKRCIKKIIR